MDEDVEKRFDKIELSLKEIGTNLKNHLKSHLIWLKFFFIPLLLMIIGIFIKVVILK